MAEDHPRSRGVYDSRRRDPSRDIGSSPLARGLHLKDYPWVSQGRIIPARAGFTLNCISILCTGRDHPRSRGVYHVYESGSWDNYGSSPLARGLPLKRRGGHMLLRIIPARAGFTPSLRPPSLRTRDHPRSRGVYFITIFQAAVAAGSSPLARGLRDHPHELPRPRRIIPARAGFTPERAVSTTRCRDHPRSRGVYP